MQDYRQLRVWNGAMELAIDVRRTANTFPRTGYAELKAQMISAAESIVNNIVEGCGSETPKEFARYLTIAIKSATELEGELQLARAYEIISDATSFARIEETVLLRKMLYALRSRLQEPERSARPMRVNPKPSNPKP